jgi:hypothetical protein
VDGRTGSRGGGGTDAADDDSGCGYDRWVACDLAVGVEKGAALMPYYAINITVVEHQRQALVKAGSKTEAIRKLRAREWEELSDPEYCTVTKNGPAKRITADAAAEEKMDAILAAQAIR